MLLNRSITPKIYVMLIVVRFALVREKEKRSISHALSGSSIEIAEVIPAKIKAIKKRNAIICPLKPILAKISGSEIKTNPGPLSGVAP